MNRKELLSDLYRTRQDFWNIHPDAGKMLVALVREKRPKQILELGTSNGLSAILMGDIVQEWGGKIKTVEYFRERIAMAEDNIAKAGLGEVIEIVEGDAIEVIKSLDEEMEFVFLDIGKDDYATAYLEARKKMKTGAVLVADNVISHRLALYDFYQAVDNDVGVSWEELDVGQGLLVVWVE
jgi:predicted O-methyltransferase YrrM